MAEGFGMSRHVMLAFGTRPEAIKMAPVVSALRDLTDWRVSVTVTGQHRQMLDQVLSLFAITPDHDLNVMQKSQGLPELFTRLLSGVSDVLERDRPDALLVHGDTSTTLASALAAFYAHVPVGHVEAGLRTGNMQAPWPEEANRRLVAPLCRWHFAPTQEARLNLLAEGHSDQQIVVTGNTVIDALKQVAQRISDDMELASSLDQSFPFLGNGRRVILVTGHRRENFGEGFEQICRALLTLSKREDVDVVYPVHLNPSVREPVLHHLGGRENVHLLEPLDYLPFVRLMQHSHIILTDSGGIQEEAPSLGKPVLVMRETTERPEAVAAGTVRLVGTSEERILSVANHLLDSEEAHSQMARSHNPYGDGQAATRIVQRLVSDLAVS
jgi:UDP-N-acetylglucosamine 2-epimerase (non-hydrolysing)